MQNRYSSNRLHHAGDNSTVANSAGGSSCGKSSACSCDALSSSGNRSCGRCRDTALEIISPSQMETLNRLCEVAGFAEIGSIVKIRIDDHRLLETVVNNDDTWVINVPFTLDCGIHTIYAISSQRCNASDFVNFCIEDLPCPCSEPCHCSCPCSEPCHCSCPCSEPCHCSCPCSEPCHCPCSCDNTDGLLEAPVITFPADGATITTGTPIITGTATPGNTVNICIECIMCARTIADENGNFSLQFQSALANGDYAVTAVQIDNAGNRSCVAHNDFTVFVET